ncbi:hypothetical protein Barb7_00021 [Bacteroidales bacterium Barb7]|nr:hypothetical protein Barb7_00072 [Bacteroidales bacterium Barb7]OAV76283.1 hypothetical protein Barb7_00082 [Bacteroidales bacterium Barb7]OAV76307.1 hypothetical protein Barb7_00021 [Bacteroidales bacterium Barb7]
MGVKNGMTRRSVLRVIHFLLDIIGRNQGELMLVTYSTLSTGSLFVFRRECGRLLFIKK